MSLASTHQASTGPAAADPRVHRLDGPLTTGLLTGLDPARLAAAGHRTLVLGETVELGAGGEFDVRFIRLLREAIAATLEVEWTAAGLDSVDLELVCHLPPPGNASALAGQWRDRYRFGRCYYRVGPGFYLLKDVRRPGLGARFRLDDERGVAAFGELERAVHLPSAAGDVTELFGVLAAERLAVQRGEWGTVLPFRMRHWPVPFLAV